MVALKDSYTHIFLSLSLSLAFLREALNLSHPLEMSSHSFETPTPSNSPVQVVWLVTTKARH